MSNTLSHVSVDKIPAIVEILWKSKKVPMLWGPPGVGKSEVNAAIAANGKYKIPMYSELCEAYPEFNAVCGQEFQGRTVYDNRLLLMNPTDLKGLPVYNQEKREAEWLLTNNLPMSEDRLEELIGILLRADKQNVDTIARIKERVHKALHDQFAIIFLDEISLAPKLVQGAALQLVLDRAIGENKMPAGVDIVAAGNRTSDKVGATSMSPALVSRMIHINIEEPNYNKWRDWAVENDVAPEIIGYLKFKPEDLFDFDAKSVSSRTGSSNFPTPRTWVFASDIYKDAVEMLDKNKNDYRHTMEALLAGTVGEGVAANFLAWVDVYVLLPDPNAVLDGKIEHIDFEEVVKSHAKDRDVKSKALSMKYAFLMALISSLSRDFTFDRANNAANFVNGTGVDDAEWAMVLVVMIVRMATDNNSNTTVKQVFGKLMKEDTPWRRMNQKLGSLTKAEDKSVKVAG